MSVFLQLPHIKPRHIIHNLREGFEKKNYRPTCIFCIKILSCFSGPDGTFNDVIQSHYQHMYNAVLGTCSLFNIASTIHYTQIRQYDYQKNYEIFITIYAKYQNKSICVFSLVLNIIAFFETKLARLHLGLL